MIAVYAGQGSSHSWTWLADLFGKVGMYDVRFVDEHDMCRALDDGCRTVVVSGGDAYMMADSFEGACFDRLRRFIDAGGIYVGVCAGAYIPLPTSVEPMARFNLSSTKIVNIEPMGASDMPDTPRARVRYCDRMIVHPVRGEVLLSVGGRTVPAPLYGGPIFCEPTDDECVARYDGPTPRTEFQTDPGRAREMLRGRPAVVRSRCGEGSMLLLGPHLEHPSYPSANAVFLEMLGVQRRARAATAGPVPEGLRRPLADLRVAIGGLEGRSFLIGHKIWDSERLMAFVEAISSHARMVPNDVSETLSERMTEARALVLASRPDDLEAMETAVDHLMETARTCVNEAFASAASSR